MGLLDKMFDNDKNDDKNRKPADFSDVKSSSPKADFSDVRSGSSSAPADTSRGRTYTVVAGDSLSKIAKREFGDANKWHAIYEANRDTIKNPDLIHPGQVLNLPTNV
jgi:nucleoid-associated protein YgaU